MSFAHPRKRSSKNIVQNECYKQIIIKYNIFPGFCDIFYICHLLKMYNFLQFSHL